MRTGTYTMCVAAAACALALASVPAASAATDLSQRAGAAGCITETGSDGQCADGRGLVGPESIALSPDGQNAYVASSTWNSVSILARNGADGALAPVSSPSGCLDSFANLYPDCTTARELGGAKDVAVSPDGKNVYVAAPADDAIDVLDRNAANGYLTQPATADGCVNEAGSGTCADGRALGGATSIAISPDGKQVYVASTTANGGLAIFDRDTDTGVLTQKAGTAGCVNELGSDGCATGLNEMLGVSDVAVSPDGKTVYAVSPGREAVTLYSRDADTGDLAPLAAPGGCVKETGADGCTVGAGTIDPASITVSPDNATAYIAGFRSDAVAVFDRDTDTGVLTQKAGTAGCVSNTGWSNPMQAGTQGACQDGTAMDGINSIAVAPDGASLYATTENSSGLVVFSRNPDGTISQRPGAEGCITDTGYEDTSLPWTAGFCGDGSALLAATHVVVSPDSRYVYATARNGGADTFDVVPPPVPVPPVVKPPPPPPPVVDGDKELNCKHALSDLHRAQHKIKSSTGDIKWESAAAARADTAIKKRKLTALAAKSRVSLKKWTRSKSSAQKRVDTYCS